MNNGRTDTDQLAEATATEIHFDTHWKALTRLANAAYDAGAYVIAERHYDFAWDEARRIFTEAWNSDGENAEHAAPMIVVSAVNSARNFGQRGNVAAAETRLGKAVEIFMQALSSPVAPPALKEACAQHMPRLLGGVKSFAVETGTDPLRFEEMFHKARGAVLSLRDGKPN